MNKKNFTKKEIKRWWNYKRNLRWNDIYKNSDYTALALNNRMKNILFHLDKLNLKKGRILEIGFGGGQLAYEILKKGYYYQGIDISKNFVKIAKKRCKKFSNNRAKFKVSSIENPLKYKSNCFDAVIVSGVFQYSTKPEFVFDEIYRVLKRDSYFICAQTNFYKFYHFFNLRSLLVRIYFTISGHQYEIANSFKSLFLETKLKKNLNSKLISFLKKKFFFNYNYVKMNFKFKKRVFSISRLKTHCIRSKFKVIRTDASGPYLKINYDKNFKSLINFLIEILSKVYFFGFLKNFGESLTIVSKK